MRSSVPRLTAGEAVLVAALCGWAAFPVVLLVIHAHALHAQLTGADGLIGAKGVLGADQLQYLAWARDAAGHGLISNLFSLAPSGHVYLEPLFALIGGLTHLGVGLVGGYLSVSKALGVIALGWAAVAWARRCFADQRAARMATVALSLFCATPLAALFGWTQWGSLAFRFPVYLLGSELSVSDKLWGYVPSAIGLALVPAALLAAERALRERSVRWTVAAGLAALMSSWLHPWQGVTLVIVFAGLAAWRRLSGWPVLLAGVAGAGLPLLYYLALSHLDPAWKLSAQYEVISRLSPTVLLAGLGPLALLAAFGVRRPGGDLVEQGLLLWIAGALINYFVNDAFATHALQGLSFPFAVLAVRGGQRARLPVVLGALVVLVFTVPGLAYSARKFVRTADSAHVQYYLPASDAAALHWIAADAPPGGVLAPTPFAAVVPGRTGRAVWVGNGYWSPDYKTRAVAVDRLFRGRLRPASAARAFVRASGARILIADCAQSAEIGRTLAPLLAETRRFGCARVYVLRRPGPPRRR